MSCYEVLVFCGFDPEAAMYAQKYSIFMFIALFFHSQFDCYRQYLTATGLARVVQYATMSTLPFHLLNCVILVIYLDLGFAGAGLAMTITLTLNFLFVMLYTWKNQTFFHKKESVRVKWVVGLGKK